MIDHVGISVGDFNTSKKFYAEALQPLGYSLMLEVTAEMTKGRGQYAGFGETRPDFWIGTGQAGGQGTHVAFQTASRDNVDRFYNAALKAGGRDNGAPGLRPQYHENYYGAFVLDPDGNNIEAVCHVPT